jgi:hypothetical protein
MDSASSFFGVKRRQDGSHELAGAHRIDLLDEAVYHTYLARPGRFADELRAVRPGTTVVVDEIQRVPALLNEVHRFIPIRPDRVSVGGSG